MKTVNLIALLCVTLTSTAYATQATLPTVPAVDGKEIGNGGETNCAEYSDFVGRIVSILYKVGQNEVDTVNPLIRVSDLWDVKRKLVCKPVIQLDRHARSYTSDTHTDLLTSEWAKLSVPQKVRLAAHELAVLANYEKDGEYFMSNDMVAIAEANSEYFKNLTLAEQVIQNPDGTVTFLKPFVSTNQGSIPVGLSLAAKMTVNKKSEVVSIEVTEYQSNVDSAEQAAARSFCKMNGFDGTSAYGANLTTYGFASCALTDKLYAQLTQGTVAGIWTRNTATTLVSKSGNKAIYATTCISTLQAVTCRK